MTNPQANQLLPPLAIRSPSCFGILKRNLNPDVQHVLARCYDSAMTHGGEELPFVHREAGVSFNPRPARVLEIAISLASITNRDYLAALCLATAQRPLTALDDEHITLEVRLLVSALQDWLRAPVYSEQPHAPLLAVLLLDHLRHLHQCPRITRPDHGDVLTYQVPWLLSQLQESRLKATLAQTLTRAQLLLYT